MESSNDPYSFEEKFEKIDKDQAEPRVQSLDSEYSIVDNPPNKVIQDTKIIGEHEGPKEPINKDPSLTTKFGVQDLGFKRTIQKKRDTLNIHCTTMNCGGQMPQTIQELLPIFECKSEVRDEFDYHPDIYVIAMQEIVSLNAYNCLVKDNKKLDQWRKLLHETLDMVNSINIQKSGRKYTQEELLDEQIVFTDKCMVGCYTAIYFKRKLISRIKEKSLQLCKIKAGNKGATGNKGAVCIRFQIDDQSVMIVNCHLLSGRRRDQQRIDQLSNIFKQAFKNNLRNRGMGVENHQQVIILGDLNFRINALSREEVLERINSGNIVDLLNQDDLILAFDRQSFTPSLKQDNVFTDMLFKNFEEGEIKFYPTYKFDLKSQQYDTSKKQRVPAYCDRILWKRNTRIAQIHYDSVHSVDFTDHRPVVAYFQLTLEQKKSKSQKKVGGYAEFLQDSYKKLQQDQMIQKSKSNIGGKTDALELTETVGEYRIRQGSRIVVDSDDDNGGIADEFYEDEDSDKDKSFEEEKS